MVQDSKKHEAEDTNKVKSCNGQDDPKDQFSSPKPCVSLTSVNSTPNDKCKSNTHINGSHSDEHINPQIINNSLNDKPNDTSINYSSSSDYVNLKIKKDYNTSFDFRACQHDSIKDLKKKLTEVVYIPMEHQRIVTAGSILQDDRRLESYNVKDSQILYILDNRPKNPSASESNKGTDNSCAQIPVNETSSNDIVSILGSNISAIPNLTNQFASTRELNELQSDTNRDTINRLMNSPMILNLMENSDLFTSLLEANPQLSELRQRNPELNHILNDPQNLRQSIEMMRNPSLMREMMRSADRAMSNIEAVPGGFNALRRMYHNIQEPIWNATVGGSQYNNHSSSETSTASFDLKMDEAPNTEALPNPWVSESSSNSSSASSPQLNGNSLLSSILSQGFRRNQNYSDIVLDQDNSDYLGSDSFLQDFMSSMSDGSPTTSALTPSTSSQLFDSRSLPMNLPAMMQAIRNMNLNPRIPSDSMSNLTDALATEDFEISFHSQLDALRNMGFTDTQACIEALRLSNGNINGAIDRLLQNGNND